MTKGIFTVDIYSLKTAVILLLLDKKCLQEAVLSIKRDNAKLKAVVMEAPAASVMAFDDQKIPLLSYARFKNAILMDEANTMWLVYGTRKDVTEAWGLTRFLMAHGIDRERIISFGVDSFLRRVWIGNLRMVEKLVALPQDKYGGALPDNSFFHADYSGKRVLVVVPHPDDEINVAGQSIVNLSRQGAEIFAAFSTNGDYSVPTEARLREMAASLSILGVDRKHIICLGYPDAYMAKNHVFYADEEPAIAPNKKMQTYSGYGFTDYAYLKFGEHSPYTHEYMKRDMICLLEDVCPDIVFCIDLDSHPDHRCLSLIFEAALGDILRKKDNKWHPEVYKKQAYALAWFARRDFYDEHLHSVRRPKVGEVASYDSDVMDTSLYSWESRVRFPVPLEHCTSLLTSNRIYHAMYCHQYGSAHLHGENLINADEVFWHRRTDNLAYQAEVRASSGDAKKANDFQLVNLRNIHLNPLQYDDYLWMPDENDKEKKLEFFFDTPQEISELRIWPNIDGGVIEQMAVMMDNGYRTEVGPCTSRKGQVIDLKIPRQVGVQAVCVQILKSQGNGCGLAEVELFRDPVPEGLIQPFIKLMLNDDFVYVHNRRKEENSFDISLYTFHVNDKIRLEILSGNAKFVQGKLIIYDEKDVVVQAACQSNSKIYDRIVFKTRDEEYFLNLHRMQMLERCCIYGK